LTQDDTKELLGDIQFEDTSSIKVPENLIDQVIGQDEGVEVIKKAAHQRRHVMLIGSPGTGKSMMGKAMAELLPVEELQDVLVYNNPEDNNAPRVRIVPAGRGKQIVDAQKIEARKKVQTRNMFFMLIVIGLVVYSYYTGQLLFGVIARRRRLMLTPPVPMREHSWAMYGMIHSSPAAWKLPAMSGWRAALFIRLTKGFCS
jgi:Lon-like ATP-dependent protease